MERRARVVTQQHDDLKKRINIMNPMSQDSYSEDNLVGPMGGHTTPSFGESKRINTIEDLMALRASASLERWYHNMHGPSMVF